MRHKQMNVPKGNEHWLQEIKNALSHSEARALNEGTELDYLYRYATKLVVKNRSISCSKTIERMTADAEERVAYDWGCDEGSRNAYLFHFVSTYIFSHVSAGLIGELVGDRIMDYVNQNMNLFKSAK